MLYNYFKIAFRNLYKHKTHSLILVGGLSLAMISCFLIILYVNYQFSFDRFHQKSDQIYRVVNERTQNGITVQKGTITYPTIGAALAKDYPEISAYTRITYSGNSIVNNHQQLERVDDVLWADEHFFSVFDFPFLAKKGDKLLADPNEILLSQDLADLLFGDIQQNYDQLIGKELVLDDYPDPFSISGVFSNIPANSTLQFDMMPSFASCIKYWGEGADNSWTWSDFYHYLVLEKGTSKLSLENKLIDFSERYFKGDEVTGSHEIFTLQPLKEAHLYSTGLEYEIGHTSSARSVLSLLIIAFFILLIAWINYINLVSVKVIERAKEVGVRKVVGAQRHHLIKQFMIEAILVNGIALFIAIQIVIFLKPWFSNQFELDPQVLSIFSGQNKILLIMGGLLMLGILLSGLYPSWLSSSTNISSVLKGTFAKKRSRGLFRKGLVIFQFTISIGLICISWFVAMQIGFANKQDLGINIDQILILESPQLTSWDSTFISKTEAFKDELLKLSGISQVATSSRAPGERMGRIFNIRNSGNPQNQDRTSYTSNFIDVDYSFADTYDLHILAGRFYRKGDHNPDFNQLENVVINEQASEMFGYQIPHDAIGKQITFFDHKWRIIGVVENFHQQSLHHAIEPILLMPFYANFNNYSVKVDPAKLADALPQIEETYMNFFPGNYFQYRFLDESFAQQYAADKLFGNVLRLFTLLTIIIACLGLFGLSSHSILQKTKEIGIRKVLGASLGSIVSMLSLGFLKLIALSVLIASPIAWILINKWLENFAYRIDVEWWVIVLSGLIAVFIAFLTIGYQSIKAAITDPVVSLKNE